MRIQSNTSTRTCSEWDCIISPIKTSLLWQCLIYTTWWRLGLRTNMRLLSDVHFCPSRPSRSFLSTFWRSKQPSSQAFDTLLFCLNCYSSVRVYTWRWGCARAHTRTHKWRVTHSNTRPSCWRAVQVPIYIPSNERPACAFNQLGVNTLPSLRPITDATPQFLLL